MERKWKEKGTDRMILKDIWLDVKAVQERDPAARNALEVLLLYQGVHALIWHRFAHWFYKHKMFFAARLISQIARFFTLIEIHPGAQLGHGILIDHGCGVVIGTLANWVGLPAWYAYAEGYYEEVGLDVEIVNFGSQGTLVNEAMAADECDIAVSGMASVYALSTGMYKYIGDGCLTISGETLYGRPDDAIYKAGADANGVYGSADALKDAVILGPMNTTAQMNAIAYMQYFGIDANSFTFTNLDYSSALAAFESGQGNLIAVNPTYAAILAADGYVQVSDFTQVSPQDIIDAVYCQNEVAEERPEDVELFLYCYYKACQDMLNNQDNRVAVAYKWYVDEGLDYKEQDVIDECSLKSYFTLDTVDSGDYLLGSFMNYAAEFLLTNEKVTEDDVTNVKASIDNSFITSIKKWASAE